ncbi:MAG: DUF4136 domain-containing protein [Marinirhabdus sp.]|nr:DUF4136 domain-containing protein [Marinirhabdus sp.]
MKVLYLLFISAILVSCGASVGVDYDKAVDFSTYSTYNFYPTIQSGLSELDDRRIMRATDSLLQMRGFVKSDTPQLFVNFYAQESIGPSRNTIGIGVGSGGRNGGIGVSGGIPIGGRVVTQELTVDLIDVAKDDLVWQAIAEDEFKEKAGPQQKEAHYVAILKKIFAKYPPKQ